MNIKRFIKQDPETGGEGGSTGGGDSGASGGGSDTSFDFEKASDSIGADLGLGIESKELDETSGEPSTTPAPAPKPAPAPSTAPAPPAPAPAPGVPTFSTEKAPNTWSAPAAAKWAGIDPEIRAEIAKREGDMFKGIEQYKGAANFAREVQQHLQPILRDLESNNVAPQQFLGNLVNAHRQLSSNLPAAQKTEMAVQLMKSYGIELPGAAPFEPETYIDPEVKALREQLGEVQSRLNGQDQRAANDTRAKISQDINTFASDPANAHFDEVAEDIALLIRGSGGTMPLKEAYEKAVYANPVTRAKETTRLTAEAVSKAEKDNQDRANKARQATRGNVRTGEHQASGTATQGSMEDTMADTLASIKKR